MYYVGSPAALRSRPVARFSVWVALGMSGGRSRFSPEAKLRHPSLLSVDTACPTAYTERTNLMRIVTGHAGDTESEKLTAFDVAYLHAATA